jgi:hypothetical protein
VSRRALALAAIGAAACGLAACGSSGTSTTTHALSAAPERTEHPARLPRGWKRVVDRRDRFSFGVPPGWRVHRSRFGELVRSADRALSLSIVYDRGGEARTLKVRAYAKRTAHALAGYRNLHVGPARRVTGERYPTATVSARGVFLRTHVRQAILVVAVRRPRRGTFALLAFRSARTRAARYAPELAELVRTLRTRR